MGPVASFPLLPEEGRDILGECGDNTTLLCFHPHFLPARCRSVALLARYRLLWDLLGQVPWGRHALPL